MRKVVLLLAIAACGGSAKTPAGPAPAPIADLSVSRFVPAHPTYLFAAGKLRDAQRAARGTIDSLGMLAGVDAQLASSLLQQVLDVDPLDEAPLQAIGVDLDGGFAAFSEDVEPTFLFHLAAPDALELFLEKQRHRGMVTQSVVADGVEVFSAKLGPHLSASWAVDKDWLWLHIGKAGVSASEWFQHSHRAVAGAWADDWAWAKGKAAGAVHGFVKVKELAAFAKNAAACARLVEPVGRVGLALDADGKGLSGRVAIELGGSAKDVAAHVLPPPPGWAAAAGNAALSVQVNVDLGALAQWVAPCATTFGMSFAQAQQLGVRSGRAMLLSFNPDDPSGTGAIALDLSSKAFFASMLDRIPMRSHLEKDKRFGAHNGHHVGIPMIPDFDYVLEDHLAIAAMGDGVLDKVVAAGPAVPAPLFAVDIRPEKLPAKAWEWLLDNTNMVGNAKRLTEQLQRWRDGHLSLAIDGDALVLDAAGHLR
jgi:hypothetical protein